jgi:hypothetical protein
VLFSLEATQRLALGFLYLDAVLQQQNITWQRQHFALM